MTRTYQKHNLRHHPLYDVWKSMKYRCHNPNNRVYKYYGGRGIAVCRGWLNNFKAFYDWAISNGYEKGLQLDRENNDSDYKPSNCRFVTSAVNNQNKRNNKLNWGLVKGIRLCGNSGFSCREIGRSKEMVYDYTS